MKPSLKKEWLRYLRNGEYQQGTRRLVTVSEKGDEQFCCLGVLCDIGLDDDWHLTLDKANTDPESPLVDAYEIGGVKTKPSNPQLGELGLEHHAMHDLVRMNDGGSLFADIATWIEENIS